MLAAQPTDQDKARQPSLRLRQGIPHRLHVAVVCLVARGALRRRPGTRHATARLRLSRSQASCKTAPLCDGEGAGETLAAAAPHTQRNCLANPRIASPTRQHTRDVSPAHGAIRAPSSLCAKKSKRHEAKSCSQNAAQTRRSSPVPARGSQGTQSSASKSSRHLDDRSPVSAGAARRRMRIACV